MIGRGTNSIVTGIAKAGFFLLMVAGSTAGVWFYQQHHSTAYQVQQLELKNHQLEADKQHLKTVVGRLTTENRVAEIIVTKQTGAGSSMRTWLLFSSMPRMAHLSRPSISS